MTVHLCGWILVAIGVVWWLAFHLPYEVKIRRRGDRAMREPTQPYTHLCLRKRTDAAPRGVQPPIAVPKGGRKVALRVPRLDEGLVRQQAGLPPEDAHPQKDPVV